MAFFASSSLSDESEVSDPDDEELSDDDESSECIAMYYQELILTSTVLIKMRATHILLHFATGPFSRNKF